MVPVLAARRPTDSFTLEDGIAAAPPLPPVAHATRSDPFDVFMGGTRYGTRDSVDTGVVAAREGAVVRLRVGLAAGFTDDGPVSQSFIKGLAELQTFFFTSLGRRLPGLSFLRDEVRHLSRTTRNTFHRYATDLMSQTTLNSILSSILLDAPIPVHDLRIARTVERLVGGLLGLLTLLIFRLRAGRRVSDAVAWRVAAAVARRWRRGDGVQVTPSSRRRRRGAPRGDGVPVGVPKRDGCRRTQRDAAARTCSSK